MSFPDKLPASCVIRKDNSESGQLNNRNDECQRISECVKLGSVQKLMQLGLSMKDIEALDTCEPSLEHIWEFASSRDDNNDPLYAAEAISITIDAIEEQIQNLDVELHMLNLRKQAIRKREKLLRKILKILGRSAVKQ